MCTNRRPNILCIVIFLAFWILSNCFAYWYVANEKTIYFWDTAIHWKRTAEAYGQFIDQPLRFSGSVLHSIKHEEYNFIPSLGIIPFYLMLGLSRFSFILAMTNSYIIFSLFFLFLLLKDIVRPKTVKEGAVIFGIASYILLVSSHFWYPLLTGFAGSGGVPIMLMIIYFYRKFPFEKQSFLLVAFSSILFVLLKFL